MSEPIQLLRPNYRVEECLSEIRECLEKGWTGLGFKTVLFENEWKKYSGFQNAHFLSSSTMGLQLALQVYKNKLNWREGDEVISTPVTFVSTNHVILHERLKPVFADIDQTLCMSPRSILSRITPRTRAVLYVGMGGNPGHLAEVTQICREKNLTLILDAAHMAGTFMDGKHAGVDLGCTVFSFHSVKNLPTADGGMICFSDPEMDRLVRELSWLGINKTTYSRSGAQPSADVYQWMYEVDHVGMKAHGNSVMASIGLVQLRYLESDNEIRRKLAAEYERNLSNVSGISLIEQIPGVRSSRHLFQVRVRSDLREKALSYLNAHSIFPGVHYRINTDYPMYAHMRGTCPEAEKATSEIMSLPLHPQLNVEHIQRVSQVLTEFVGKNK